MRRAGGWRMADGEWRRSLLWSAAALLPLSAQAALLPSPIAETALGLGKRRSRAATNQSGPAAAGLPHSKVPPALPAATNAAVTEVSVV